MYSESLKGLLYAEEKCPMEIWIFMKEWRMAEMVSLPLSPSLSFSLSLSVPASVRIFLNDNSFYDILL